MDDFLACSDLCEENGFPRQAGLLRSLAGAGKAYVVVERGWEYNDEINQPSPDGAPKAVYADRAEAERVAASRNAEMLREVNILDIDFGLAKITDLPAGELSRRIAEILGEPFDLLDDESPAFAHGDERIFPEGTTDEQMLRIADLFKLKFFYVVETRFAE